MKETVGKKNSAHAPASKSPHAPSKLIKANELLSRVNPADIGVIARKPTHR